MRNKRMQRDRFDERLARLARQGKTWEQVCAARKAAGAKAWETRRRRERGEPEPPPPPRRKLASDALLWWSNVEGRVCVRTNRRPALIDDFRNRVPKAARWFRDFDRTWVFDADVLGEVHSILVEHFEHVSIDLEVARRLGFLIFDPQGPDGEEVAA